MRLAAFPNFCSPKMDSRASFASSLVEGMITPFPAASPSTLMTHGMPRDLTALSPSSREVQTVASAVGISYFFMNSLEKTFDPSISAARRVGPKIKSPRFWNSSTIPRVRGSSGPTTVRSIFSFSAKSASSMMSATSICTQ